MSARRSMTTEAIWAREHGRPLTSEHVKLIRLLSYGMTLREVSEREDVAYDTVKMWARVAYARLGVRNAAHAVRCSLEQGLIGAGVDVLPPTVAPHAFNLDEGDLEDEVDP